MNADTKKTLVGGGVWTGGAILVCIVASILYSGNKPVPVEPLDEEAITLAVTAEANRAIEKAKKEYVETPDAVFADTMVWLNDNKDKTDARMALLESSLSKQSEDSSKTDERLIRAIETLSSAQAESTRNSGPDERTMTMLERLTAKITELESKDSEKGLALDMMARRINSEGSSARDAELTKVFEAFDGRISRFESIPRTQPTIRTSNGFGMSTGLNRGNMRLVADVAPDPNAEVNARLSRMEAMLAGERPAPDADGLNAAWGKAQPIVRERLAPVPAARTADAGAVPKDTGKGIIRTTAGAAGETLEGGTDIATTTVNNVTNVAGRGVKDSVRTVSRLLGGTAETAGSTIGDTSNLAKKQGKSIWKKFW